MTQNESQSAAPGQKGSKATDQRTLFEIGMNVRFVSGYAKMFPNARLSSETGTVIKAGAYNPDHIHIQFDDGRTTDSRPEYLEVVE